MKITLTKSNFIDLLRNDPHATWSYDGAIALFAHLSEMEIATGEELDFDLCAIRSEWAEYDNLVSWADDYFGNTREFDIHDGMSEDEIADVIRRYIKDHGTLIKFDGGVIVSNF